MCIINVQVRKQNNASQQQRRILEESESQREVFLLHSLFLSKYI